MKLQFSARCRDRLLQRVELATRMGMAVYQAVKAFEVFIGIVPDRDRMIDHFRAAA